MKTKELALKFWEKLLSSLELILLPFGIVFPFILIIGGLCLSLGIENGYINNLRDLLINININNNIGSILIDAGVGFATASMVLYIALQVREIRKDRDLSLRKEHTEDLRKKIVKQWIKYIESSKKANITIDLTNLQPHQRIMKYYAESVLMLKENEKILFNGFLENHASRELSMAFERFEESFKKLDKLLKKLENDVEKFLNENGIEFIDNENDIDSEIEHEKMLFIKPDTLSLFLDCLINNTVENIKIQRGYERRYPYLIYSFYCKDTGSATGKYMCVERIAEEERKQHIKNTIENLLKEAKEKFKNDMKEIHNLINEINESNKTILDELKKFEYKQIYDGDCEYIKYP